MSRTIIETAVSNKTLHLELTYRLPSMPCEEEDDTAELEPQTRDASLPPVQTTSSEFACLLSVL